MLLTLLGLVVTACQPAAGTLAVTARRYVTEKWAYVPDFDRSAAWASGEANAAKLNGLSLFNYHLDANGNVVEYPNLGSVPAGVTQQGVPLAPVVANIVDGAWNRDMVAQVITNPERRRYHIQQIVDMVMRNNYPGVEVDYESLTASEREPYAQFVEELAQALHARQKSLAVAVHAKTAEPGVWGGPQAQDWRRIGAAADRVVVLTYDYDPAKPSPVAPPDWTRQVLQFALTQMPAKKVVQGVPLYGYDWVGSNYGVGKSYRELTDLARQHDVQPRRDARSQHLTFEYDDPQGHHTVWLADAATVAALLDVGQEVGVAAQTFWRLGGEDPTVWSKLGPALR